MLERAPDGEHDPVGVEDLDLDLAADPVVDAQQRLLVGEPLVFGMRARSA
jgi:hypothetical protein